MIQTQLKKRWIDCSIADCSEQARWYKPGEKGSRRIFYCRAHRKGNKALVRLPHKHDLEWARCVDCSTPFLRPAAGGGRGVYCPEHRRIRHAASVIKQRPSRMVTCRLKLMVEDEELLVTDTITVSLLRSVTFREVLMKLVVQHADTLRRQLKS